MPAVSVVILTRNRLAKLARCLELLLPQLEGEDEVVLIDTGSTDGTLERFESDPPPRVKLHRFAGPGSFAEARNFGVARARNPLIAFLDDDCYAAPDWVARGRELLERWDAAGGLVEPHGIDRWPDWWAPEMGWLVGISVPGHLGPEAGRYFYPYTSNLWVRAEVARAEPFQELGGEFQQREESRYITGREDAEWWRRIRVNGCTTAFDPALCVEHHIEPERIDLGYLRERAAKDGEAWARREGRAEDMRDLAYQIWARIWPERPRPGEIRSQASPRAMGNFHAIIRRRHFAALRALAFKIGRSPDARAPASCLLAKTLSLSFTDSVRDRSKTIARRVVLKLAPTHSWKPLNAPPAKIGVVAFGFLGDLVILQSVVRGLIESRPALKIELLAPPAAEAIFGGMRSDRFGFHVFAPGSAPPEAPFDPWLRSLQGGVVFAPYLHGPFAPPFIRAHHSLGALAPPLMGFDGDDGLLRQLDRARINLRVEKRLGLHESENLCRLFAAARLIASPQPAQLAPTPEAAVRAAAWRASLPVGTSGLPMIMLNPDAGHAQKEWPEESWLAALALLLKEFPHVFAINLSRERPEFERALERFEDPVRVVLLNRLPLDDLIATLALCDGLITVDAGPQHLAHALGVPSLTLYGPMDERRWGDRWKRPIHQTIRRGMFDLTPEERRGLPENHQMRWITPEALVAKAHEWMKSFTER